MSASTFHLERSFCSISSHKILCFPSLHFSDHCTKLVLNGLRRYQRAALCILMQSPLDDISHFHTYTNRHPAPDSESADTHFLSAAAFP